MIIYEKKDSKICKRKWSTSEISETEIRAMYENVLYMSSVILFRKVRGTIKCKKIEYYLRIGT